MSTRKTAQEKQAKFRSQLRSRGLREIKAWVPEDVQKRVVSAVAQGQFESQTAAYADAIVRAFGTGVTQPGN